MDAKFSIATDDEFVEAFDRVVSLLRELLALERVRVGGEAGGGTNTTTAEADTTTGTASPVREQAAASVTRAGTGVLNISEATAWVNRKALRHRERPGASVSGNSASVTGRGSSPLRWRSTILT